MQGTDRGVAHTTLWLAWQLNGRPPDGLRLAAPSGMTGTPTIQVHASPSYHSGAHFLPRTGRSARQPPGLASTTAEGVVALGPAPIFRVCPVAPERCHTAGPPNPQRQLRRDSQVALRLHGAYALIHHSVSRDLRLHTHLRRFAVCKVDAPCLRHRLLKSLCFCTAHTLCFLHSVSLVTCVCILTQVALPSCALRPWRTAYRAVSPQVPTLLTPLCRLHTHSRRLAFCKAHAPCLRHCVLL